MTDIFNEVQEDLRRERAKAIWDRFGWLFVAVVVLVVGGVGGWRAWQYFDARAAAEAGDRYQAAAKLADDGKTDEARAAFAAIVADGRGGYPTLAKLRAANESTAKDPAAALKLYTEVAGDASADPLLRDTARARGGYLAVDQTSRDEVRRLIEPLALGEGPWLNAAREILGLSAYKAGDMAEARRQFEAVVSDPEAPPATRQRADLMLAVVPAPEPAPPAN
jgi:hypothetical protein